VVRQRAVLEPAPDTSDRDEALAWLGEQAPGLLAVAHDAVGRGHVGHANQVSSLLFRYLLLDHVDEAASFYERFAEATGGTYRGGILNALGALRGSRGQFRQANDAFAEALRHLEKGDETGVARRVISNLGAVSLHLGALEDSMRYSHRALELDAEVGDAAAAGRSLNNLALVLARVGRYEEAAEHHARAWALIESFGDPLEESRARRRQGVVRLRQGRHDLARPLLTEALVLAQRVRYTEGEAEATHHLATLDSFAGRHDEAIQGHRDSAERMRVVGAVAEETGLLNDLGDSLVRAGRAEEARAVYEATLGMARERAERYDEARSLAGLAEAASMFGAREESEASRAAAERLFAGMGCSEVPGLVGQGSMDSD
jgi:tetratricopeptide (TPR) repeat protein